MIADGMQRVRQSIDRGDRDALGLHCERVVRLVDLTLAVHRRPSLWREILRRRGLVAELYLAREPRRAEHDALLRCLLPFTPGSARQFAHL